MISRQKLKIRSNYPSALSYWALGNRPMTEANRPGYVCISNPSLSWAPHSTAAVDARQLGPALPPAEEAPHRRSPLRPLAAVALLRGRPKEPRAGSGRRSHALPAAAVALRHCWLMEPRAAAGPRSHAPQAAATEEAPRCRGPAAPPP